MAGAVAALLLAGCAGQVEHPSALNDAELAEYLDEAQNRAWFYSSQGNETRPEVAPEFVHLDDMGGPFTDCLADDEVSDVVCDMTYVYYPGDIGYFSASELGYVYDYFADELVPCLATLGLEMTYFPTRDEFTATAGFMSWEPYVQLGADLPPSRADAILADCPRYPPMPFSGLAP